MINQLLEIIQAKYPLREIEAGDMKSLKANGMTFSIQAYKAKGLGHISAMQAKGFFGLMKMDTLIINPTEVDLPLYSYDRIFAMGNDTLIVELYDTLAGAYSEDALQAVKGEYTDLAERDPGEHWYDSIKLAASISKKGKKNQSSRFDEMTLQHFEAYLSDDATPVSDVTVKQEKASYYVNGLLEKGGPSTDVFKKALGEEKTAKLFGDILFGTKIE